MIQLWKLIQVELISRMRDKSFWLEALLLPLVVTTIMGLALGGVGRGKTPAVNVGLVANSPEVLTAQVLAIAFKASGTLKVEHYSDIEEARKLLRSSQLDALVVVPNGDPSTDPKAGLNATVESGRATQFKAMMVAQITESTLRAMAAEMGARRAVADMLVELHQDPSPAWSEVTPIPVSARLDQLQLQRFDVLGAQFAGLAIFFSLLSAFRMMINIFGDHRHGLNLRLAGIPVRSAFVAGGYIGTVALVASLQTFTVLALGRAAFGVKWGLPLPLIVATVLAALASASVALTLAVLPGSAATRGLVGMLVVLGGSVLGGSLVPLDGASPTLQFFAQATLHYWVTGLFTGLARGLPVAEVWRLFVGVALYGAGALTLASIFLARRGHSRA